MHKPQRARCVIRAERRRAATFLLSDFPRWKSWHVISGYKAATPESATACWLFDCRHTQHLIHLGERGSRLPQQIRAQGILLVFGDSVTILSFGQSLVVAAVVSRSHYSTLIRNCLASSWCSGKQRMTEAGRSSCASASGQSSCKM